MYLLYNQNNKIYKKGEKNLSLSQFTLLLCSFIFAVCVPEQVGWLMLVHIALWYTQRENTVLYQAALLFLSYSIIHSWLFFSIQTYSSWNMLKIIIVYFCVIFLYVSAYVIAHGIFLIFKKYCNTKLEPIVWSLLHAGACWWKQYYSLSILGSFGGLFCADIALPCVIYWNAWILYVWIPEFFLLWFIFFLGALSTQTIASRGCQYSILSSILLLPFLFSFFENQQKTVYEKTNILSHKTFYFLPYAYYKNFKSGRDFSAYCNYLQIMSKQKVFFLSGESCLPFYKAPVGVSGIYGGTYKNGKGAWIVQKNTCMFQEKYHLMPYTETVGLGHTWWGCKKTFSQQKHYCWSNIGICSDMLCASLLSPALQSPESTLFFLTDESWFEHSWLYAFALFFSKKLACKYQKRIWYIGKYYYFLW